MLGDPFTEKDAERARRALRRGRSGVRTICNVLRDLYVRLEVREDKRLVEEAVWMAKRMNRKLR